MSRYLHLSSKKAQINRFPCADKNDTTAGHATAFLGHWIPAIHAGMTPTQASALGSPAEPAPAGIAGGLPEDCRRYAGTPGAMEVTTNAAEAPPEEPVESLYL
jgi:hypothetical protein